MSKPEVYILKRNIAGVLEDRDFEESAREIMQGIHVQSDGRDVMMKPNVTAGAPRNSGIVTHPSFVGGLVDYFVKD
ncbi:MAG: hypothetical protein QGI34_13885, partial [Candidatus Latescibacteria bacterium]|nr:hypothetical protein [Candidatus Latescibacterota bacterium]